MSTSSIFHYSVCNKVLIWLLFFPMTTNSSCLYNPHTRTQAPNLIGTYRYFYLACIKFSPPFSKADCREAKTTNESSFICLRVALPPLSAPVYRDGFEYP